MTLNSKSYKNSYLLALLDPNSVKFGITTALEGSIDTTGESIVLPDDKPLSFAVEIACDGFNFKNPVEYALKFSEPAGHYVTEATRKELTGKLINLCFSPEKISRDFIKGLQSDSDDTITHALVGLTENATDPTLVNAFVGLNGLSVLVKLLEQDKLTCWFESGLENALRSLLSIMVLSSEASWHRLSSVAVSRVAAYVNNSDKTSSTRALGPALQVLQNAATLGSAYSQVDKEVTFEVLLTHLQNADPKVQQKALAVIIILLGKADANKLKALAALLKSRKYREIIGQNLIQKAGERSSETNRQLYVLQTVLLSAVDEKRLTSVQPEDQDAQLKIKELFRIAFETQSVNYPIYSCDAASHCVIRDESANKKDYRRLGFCNEENPALDFSGAPPGALALECMFHFATFHADEYSQVVLESCSRTTGDGCPFARSSVALVTLLCEILQIGEPPSDPRGKFYPFMFQHERAFEELYCICAVKVAKTWKEMRATAEDFEKVFDVISYQICRTLEYLPDTFESLKSLLNLLSYKEIVKKRQVEVLYKEDLEHKAKPIQDLREAIKPEIVELIKFNRLNYLVHGTKFQKTSKGMVGLTKTKDKFWFCRLSSNTEIFFYGACDETGSPLPGKMQNELNVVDIKDLVTGNECPHIKAAKSKKGVSLAFSIVTECENEEPKTVDFMAPDKKTFDLWTDGINALLDKDMQSKEAAQEFEILMDMEIKVRLLEIDDISEQLQECHEPPPIPELPEDFDFANVQARFSDLKYNVFN